MRTWRQLVLLALLGCITPASQTNPEPVQAPLILVSIDGYRWDFDERVATPSLDRIAAEGVRADRLLPVFPSKTFPNHYTQVTGLWPAHHGIVSNDMYDPELDARFAIWDRTEVSDARWWQGEPIWVTAEKQGLRTAPLFWPGSEAPIQGVRPSYWRPFEYGLSNEENVDRLLALLDLPPPERPAFLTLYLHTVDGAAHDSDPEGSPEVATAIAQADQTLARLISGLEARGLYDDSHLLVISDHGMAATSQDRVLYPGEVLDAEKANVISWDPIFTAWPAPENVQEIKSALETLPHLQVYLRDELPERYHYRNSPRIPPIVAIADEGWSIESSDSVSEHGDGPGGSHGYDPDIESMGGIFFARGPALQSGLEVEAFRSIHLYNLMCHILEIEPAANDGDFRVVKAMLKPGRP